MRSLDSAYFERIYAQSDDPWNFATSEYEREKYAATLALLGDRRFAHGFEIGCSIGVLSGMLATRCTKLLAVDINDKALAAARARNASLAQITFAKMNVPNEFPTERFDLIIVSEVGYYWSDTDLQQTRDLIATRGTIVELVHFLPVVPEYVRNGDAVHESFLADPRFRRLSAKRAERYRIDVLEVVMR